MDFIGSFKHNKCFLSVTRDQVKRLFETYFRMLSEGHEEKGLTYSDLARHCDKTNPLRERILLAFFGDEKRGLDRKMAIEKATMTFEKYCKQMSIFLPEGNPERKLRFLFRIYDERNVGYLTREDLMYFLHDMLTNSLNATQREMIASRMFQEMSGTEERGISLQQFLDSAKGLEKLINVRI